MLFTLKQLKEQEILRFSNEHNLDAEAFEIEVETSQLSTWDNPFKLWVNGELFSTFKTFESLFARAGEFVRTNGLELVEEL